MVEAAVPLSRAPLLLRRSTSSALPPASTPSVVDASAGGVGHIDGRRRQGHGSKDGKLAAAMVAESSSPYIVRSY